VKGTYSLRVRLLAVFVGVTAIVLALAAVGMSTLVEQTVWGPFDTALAEEGETLCGLLSSVSTEDVQRAAERIAAEPQPGPRKFIRLVGRSGALLQVGQTPRAAQAMGDMHGEGVRMATFGPTHRPYRLVWTSPDAGCTAMLGVAANRPVRQIARARTTIAVACFGLLVTLAALAGFVTRSATNEIARLTEEIETIEAGSLHRRLAARHTREVDRLVGVLNRLLARLDVAMDHLRRFTADAAHELRTPVAALRARLEVTIGGPPDAYRDGLLDTLEQAERLEKLAEDLLTLSAVEARAIPVTLEPTRIDVLAREVFEFLEPIAQEQGRRFACDAAKPVLVRAAPQLLKRVMVNLVDNAFRHTPAPADVRIEVDAAAQLAEIRVHDRGPGLRPEDAQHLFDRFRRGTNGGPGSGLGLALCREIVACHNGVIDVASEPGHGTTVTVRLPLVMGPV
jgi:signal transduction histidine kinase